MDLVTATAGVIALLAVAAGSAGSPAVSSRSRRVGGPTVCSPISVCKPSANPTTLSRHAIHDVFLVAVPIVVGSSGPTGGYQLYHELPDFQDPHDFQEFLDGQSGTDWKQARKQGPEILVLSLSHDGQLHSLSEVAPGDYVDDGTRIVVGLGSSGSDRVWLTNTHGEDPQLSLEPGGFLSTELPVVVTKVIRPARVSRDNPQVQESKSSPAGGYGAGLTRGGQGAGHGSWVAGVATFSL